MSKINLKALMDPDECGRYLSAALDKQITAKDVLYQVSQGRMTPSWYVQGLHAQMVFPVSRLFGGWIHHEPATGLPRWPLGGVEGYEVGERRVLEGFMRVDTERNLPVRAWALAASRGKKSDMLSLDGVIIEDGAGNLWQALTYFGEGYSTVPLSEPLPISDLVIQQKDADEFLGLAMAKGEPAPEDEPDSEAIPQARPLTKMKLRAIVARLGRKFPRLESAFNRSEDWIKACRPEPHERGMYYLEKVEVECMSRWGEETQTQSVPMMAITTHRLK